VRPFHVQLLFCAFWSVHSFNCFAAVLCSPTFESYLQQNSVLSFSCSSTYGSVQLYIWLVAARQLLGCRCAFGSLTDYCMSAKSQLFGCSLGCSMTFVWVQLDNCFGCSLAFGCVQHDNCLGAAWGAASQLFWCILTTGLVQVDIGCSTATVWAPKATGMTFPAPPTSRAASIVSGWWHIPLFGWR
jgi:hypothetical protein